MKAIVISNCQVQPLKHYLTLVCEGVWFEGFGVHLISPEEREEKVAELAARSAEYDLVLSVPLSDEYGPLSASRIRETFQDQVVTTITNVYFDGLHPDLTYIGGFANRINGPLGDYHSFIAAIGCAAGLNVEQTLALYNPDIYERLGYFRRAEESLGELRRREEQVDVPASPLIEAMLPIRPTFLSVNHPTAALLMRYSEEIGRYLRDRHNITQSEWPGLDVVPDWLAMAAVFPVYPEIARHLGLSYRGSYRFKPATTGDIPIKTIPLEDFVTGEFAAFQESGFAPERLGHLVNRIRDARSLLNI